MPRPADEVGVPPRPIGRPCATQHRSGECGAYHAYGPVQKTAPAGRKGISAIPFQDMVGGRRYGTPPRSHTFPMIRPPTYRRAGARSGPERRRSRPVRRIRTPATYGTHITNGRRSTDPVASCIAPRAIPYGAGTLRISRGMPRHALAMPRPRAATPQHDTKRRGGSGRRRPAPPRQMTTYWHTRRHSRMPMLAPHTTPGYAYPSTLEWPHQSPPQDTQEYVRPRRYTDVWNPAGSGQAAGGRRGAEGITPSRSLGWSVGCCRPQRPSNR